MAGRAGPGVGGRDQPGGRGYYFWPGHSLVHHSILFLARPGSPFDILPGQFDILPDQARPPQLQPMSMIVRLPTP